MMVEPMSESFRQFFRRATDGQEPYPYQVRFAEADSLSHLLRAPTGAGKTAAAILGWLWRWISSMPGTPRRLAYCLPMRVLVEQSARSAERWIDNLQLDIPVHVLMGGVETEEWFLHPEKPAVLIGTQDMLLSRALNRGYAASRFHWPIDFGLLNNDCLWIFDEPQLMGSGVSTSAQLAGLRKALQTFGACPSVWMSATLEPCWLDTIDFRGKFPGRPLELDERDYDPGLPLYKRMTAVKTLRPLGAASSKGMKEVAKKVLEKHVPGTQTLVVLNTVDRAKEVYEAIRKDKKGRVSLLLVHSRFRPPERRLLNEALQQQGDATKDRLLVATQVVEAGVDISARTLITELAPWSSIVQRMGRCNRTGDDGPGQVFWAEVEEKLSLPYSPEDLALARNWLSKLDGASVSPRALDEFKETEKIHLPFQHQHVLRRRDLLDLFDTTPDLSGNDIDIQRFVRGDDPETDVQMFWRKVGSEIPVEDQPSPRRDELCNVPVGQARTFLEALAEKKRGAGYVWDHLDEQWVKLDSKQVRPGLTILLPASAGGYDWNEESGSGTGWDGGANRPVTPVAGPSRPEEGAASDTNSARGGPPLTIAMHTENVCREFEDLLQGIAGLVPDWEERLRQAARWHDVGKAHEAFQHGMRTANPALDPSQLWAKSGVKARLRHRRNHFRHELASALVGLQHNLSFEVAYLMASHHGKVRMGIRALPGEPDEKDPPPTPDTLFALGVYDGDVLPAVDLGGQQKWNGGQLDLAPMQLGGERSWTANALRLLAALGPFRLAYLEALLRAADVQASRKEAGDG
jgi:CRISPR-associated endonuclease/helicase Cas3